MNIYALDDDPRIAASFYLDRDLEKGAEDIKYLLAMAHRYLDGREVAEGRIKNLPRRIEKMLESPAFDWEFWLRVSTVNYSWAWELLAELVAQQATRLKISVSTGLVHELRRHPLNIEVRELRTPFPTCVPDWAPRESDPVLTYRRFYHELRFNAVKREHPPWSLPAKKPFWWSELDVRQAG